MFLIASSSPVDVSVSRINYHIGLRSAALMGLAGISGQEIVEVGLSAKAIGSGDDITLFPPWRMSLDEEINIPPPSKLTFRRTSS
jgi:hypothetical protein